MGRISHAVLILVAVGETHCKKHSPESSIQMYLCLVGHSTGPAQWFSLRSIYTKYNSQPPQSDEDTSKTAWRKI